MASPVHLDLRVRAVEAAAAAHDEVMDLGATLLQDAGDHDAAEGHRIYASPAGHPFCIGWHRRRTWRVSNCRG